MTRLPKPNAETSNLGSRRQLLGGVGALAALAAGAAAAQSAASPASTPQPLKGKVAIVTGARNNQGRAYAIALARMGADVMLHFHRAETQDQNDETVRLVRAQGARVAQSLGDLGEVANVKKVFDTAQSAFGRIDIVVNTVGVIVKKPLVDVTEAEYERCQRANTKATLFVMQEAARRLADGGRIIHIGTSLTAGSTPNYALYAGTKRRPRSSRACWPRRSASAASRSTTSARARSTTASITPPRRRRAPPSR